MDVKFKVAFVTPADVDVVVDMLDPEVVPVTPAEVVVDMRDSVVVVSDWDIEAIQPVVVKAAMPLEVQYSAMSMGSTNLASAIGPSR